jgi:hypothetical protein
MQKQVFSIFKPIMVDYVQMVDRERIKTAHERELSREREKKK